MFPALQNAEITAGITPLSPGEIAAALPGTAPSPAAKPFLQSFGILGPFDFVTLFLCLALGTAALPSLLVRSGVTSSLAEQRRSSAWALLFVAAFVITAPAMAVFAKLIIFRDLALAPSSALPGWLAELSANQLLQTGDANGDGTIGAAELFIGRDGVTLALPSAAGLPYVLTVLMGTAALAVALAAAAAHLFTLGASLAEDLYRVLDRHETLPRIVAAWAAIAATALAAVVFLVIADLDPLKTALLAFAFAGATFFPTLLLAIWWPRCTKWGALAALGAGFAMMLIEVRLRRSARARSDRPDDTAGEPDRRRGRARRGRWGQPLYERALEDGGRLSRSDARPGRRYDLRSRANARRRHRGRNRCGGRGRPVTVAGGAR